MYCQPFGVNHKNLSKVISYFKIVSYYKLVSYYLGSRNYTYQLLLVCLCLRTKLLDTMFDSRGVNAKRKLEVMDGTKVSLFFLFSCLTSYFCGMNTLCHRIYYFCITLFTPPPPPSPLKALVELRKFSFVVKLLYFVVLAFIKV